jgi:hypothetical protein
VEDATETAVADDPPAVLMAPTAVSHSPMESITCVPEQAVYERW